MSMHRPVSLIVAEKNADWTPWADQFRAEASDDVVCFRQEGSESLAQFSMRLRGKLSELEREGRAPARAVLVGGGRSDKDAVASRSLVIRALVNRMAHAGGGTVQLDDTGADRFSMAALAATVSELVRGSGVSVAHSAAQSAAPSHLSRVA